MNISLALSGGGVKGFSHIGVLRILEKEGYHIGAVAGTSVGGLVGALYAAGYSPDEMAGRLMEVDQGHLFARLHGDGPALLGMGGVIAVLNELLGERTFEDLRIPLAITSTDLSAGIPVIIKQGRLLDAVLATSAVPGVFPARCADGRLLVDGGAMVPIPVSEARRLNSGAPVVAVVLSPKLGAQGTSEESFENVPLLMTNLPLVYRLAGRLRLAQAFNIFIHSMDLTGMMLMEKQLELEQPEVIIRPELGSIGLVDRIDVPEVIRAGELAALKALPELHREVSWPIRLSRKLARLFSPRIRPDGT